MVGLWIFTRYNEQQIKEFNLAFIHFVLGGSNSGKSQFAEKLSLELSSQLGKLYFVATGVAFDKEMQQKIDLHKRNRSNKFLSIDSSDLSTDIFFNATKNDVILIDCISVFVSNILCMNEFDEAQIDKFKLTLEKSKAHLVIVGQETSLGVIPDNKLSRKFLNLSGSLNQFVAEVSNEVSFITAGIPQKIKGQKEKAT